MRRKHKNWQKDKKLVEQNVNYGGAQPQNIFCGVAKGKSLKSFVVCATNITYNVIHCAKD